MTAIGDLYPPVPRDLPEPFDIEPFVERLAHSRTFFAEAAGDPETAEAMLGAIWSGDAKSAQRLLESEARRALQKELDKLPFSLTARVPRLLSYTDDEVAERFVAMFEADDARLPLRAAGGGS